VIAINRAGIWLGPASANASQHNNPRDARQSWQKPRHVARPKRHATGGGAEIVGGVVKEDRAAAPAARGHDIVIHHADDVVEFILAPHLFMAEPRRRAQRTIIMKAARIVAPEIVALCSSPWRQQRHGAPQVKKQQRMFAGGRCAIAFAFGAGDPAAADGAGQNQRAGVQARFMRLSADPAGDAQLLQTSGREVQVHDGNC
jgi:hypothetical protein